MRYLKLAIPILAYALISSPAFAQTCCPAGCAPEANRCVTTGPPWTRCVPIACAEDFPEVDRAEWFDIEFARTKMLSAQVELLDRLLAIAAESDGK
jgi:hypothetical protein